MALDVEKLSEAELIKLRVALGLKPMAEPRTEPATKQQWAPGKDGKGEWVLAIAEDDFREQPVPYPVPRIVAIPDIYAHGMDQFSAVNNNTKRSVYDSKGYLPVPEPGSVQCPLSEYVRLMDRYNQERLYDKKKPLPLTPNEIPGPWGTKAEKPAPKQEAARGRA